MKNIGFIVVSSLVVMVAGCATSAPTLEKKSEKTISSKKAGATDVAKQELEKTKTGLPAQALANGECGLFLWTRRETPEFVFFSKSGEETAKFWFEKKEQALARTGVGGEVFGQQLTQQFFKLPDGRKLELTMTPGDMLVGGQRVPEASFRITDAEGWATMIPSAGVTVCKATEQ